MGDVLRSAHAQCISGNQMEQTGGSSDEVLDTQHILWHQAQGGVVDHRRGKVNLTPKMLSASMIASGSMSY